MPVCNKYLVLIIVCLTLVLTAGLIPSTAQAHCAGKHTGNHPHCANEPPPPPDPEPTVCEGVFPAFAYSQRVVSGKNRKQKTRYDLYLSNESGDCSVLVFSNSEDYLPISFQLNANGEGRIVWPEGGGATIQSLSFTVADGAVTSSLPLTESTLWVNPVIQPVSINDVELAQNGNNLFFSIEQPDLQGEGIGSIQYTRFRIFRAANRPVLQTRWWMVLLTKGSVVCL